MADGFLSRARTALKTAEHLLRETNDFASTISRAYYAILFASRALLAREGVEPRTHKGVFMQLGRLYFKTGRFPLHHNRALERAEDLRMLSDYADELDLDRSEAEQVVQDARAFVADAELLLSERP